MGDFDGPRADRADTGINERKFGEGRIPRTRLSDRVYEPLIRASGNGDAVTLLTDMCAHAKAGLDFEMKHGRWSLLKHEHPATAELKKHGFYQNLPFEAA